MEMKIIKTNELESFEIRSIRQSIFKELKNRIKEKGFNPARPLTVVKINGSYKVADGNHRLKVAKELGIKEIPCVIRKGDIYNLAVTCNDDEDTYAPMDLFDWLDIISKLSKNYTQKEIGEKIGWSRSKVSQYTTLLKNVATETMCLAKNHQLGRVAESASKVADFTERWFRDSGMYDLNEDNQLKFMQNFIDSGCNWSKSKVQKETAKLKQQQDFKKIAKDQLHNQEHFADLAELIENDNFRNQSQLLQRIESFNKKAKNKLINGDAVSELERLEDASIDLVITDPPYGIDYSSNRSKFDDHVTKEKIDNDSTIDVALKLFEETLEVLMQKTKANSHFYFFTSWKVYSDFKKVVDKYLDIKNMIIWDKGNHGAGDLTGSWGNKHELIIFATKGNKTLNTRKQDILAVSKLSSNKMIHPTQKPVKLIKELLEVSAQKADIVCDPFMGSGSTIKAVKEYGGLNYIGIELDNERFEKAKSFIGRDE